MFDNIGFFVSLRTKNRIAVILLFTFFHRSQCKRGIRMHQGQNAYEPDEVNVVMLTRILNY